MYLSSVNLECVSKERIICDSFFKSQLMVLAGIKVTVTREIVIGVHILVLLVSHAGFLQLFIYFLFFDAVFLPIITDPKCDSCIRIINGLLT